MKHSQKLIYLAIFSGIILTLVWISNDFQSLRGLTAFSIVSILSAGLLILGGLALKKEDLPRWIGWLVVGAVILRLGAGILWFTGLPRWGYGNEGEVAGYIMSDAHNRDAAAWELSQSEKPLIAAFKNYRLADQYGGFLFFSAAVYRLFGTAVHQPLLIVAFTSAFSGLGVLFTWAFTKRLWGKPVGNLAAWILAIYPEAVLLGSSQTREAITTSLAAIAIYGVVTFWQDRSKRHLGWALFAFLFGIPISYLFAVLLAGTLLLLVLVLNKGKILKNWRLWGALILLMLIGILAIWALGDRIFPEGAANPIDALNRWLRYAAKWESRNTTLLSGWIDKIFNLSPDWMHAWIILGYGVVQPFLPAALIASGNPMWRMIAIWRSLGWTLLLFLLVYAAFRASQRFRKQHIPLGISIIVWIGIFLSAYRGGGDQWDNPRYRAIFVSLQAALAAWVWIEQKANPGPWLRRILVGAGFVFAWFIPWYLRRYFPVFVWPVEDLFKTLGLGLVTAVLYWVWDWVREHQVE